jgi:hypothetical protein
MRKFLLATTMALIGTLGVTAAQAGPLPAGATCVGNCGTDVADGVVTLSPLGTSSYLYVSTRFGANGAGEIAGVGGTNGSLLTTPTFSANAGDSLNFYFNYVTSDGANYSDYAFAHLLDSTNTLVATLFTARTEPSGNTSPGAGLPANDSVLTPTTSAIIPGGPHWSELGGDSGQCFAAGCGYTGWIQSTYTILAAGNYTLAFGATNVLDTQYNTGLAIDGVTVAGIPVIPTPEPATLSLLSLGLGGLAILRRRRR